MSDTTTDEARGSRRVPMAVALLGGAGLLPPLLAIFARLSAGQGNVEVGHFAMLVALVYVSLILSFIGGLWWGIAAVRLPPERMSGLIGLSVLPSLAAFFLFILSNWFPGPSVVALAFAIAATLLVDRRLAARRLVPRWWMRLRVPLSGGLAVLTLVLAVLL